MNIKSVEKHHVHPRPLSVCRVCHTQCLSERSLYILFSYCSTFLTIQFVSMRLCCVRLLNHVLLAGDEQDSGEG